MSTSNLNYTYLDGRYSKPSDLSAAIAAAAPEMVQYLTTSGPLTAGAGTAKFVFPFATTVLGVTPSLGTQANLDVIVDVNKNGTSIFTTQLNRPTIATGAFVGPEKIPDVTSFASGDYITIDCDQIGGPSPISYVGSSSYGYASGSPRVITRPAGSQMNDIHIALIELYQEGGTGTSVTPPSGWTQIGSALIGPNNAGGPEQIQYYFWARDDGITGSWSFGISGASASLGCIYTYHNCITTGSPIDAFAVAQLAYSTTFTTPSVTTTAANDLVISSAVPSNSIGTITVPTGMTQRESTTLADQIQLTPGPSGSKVWSGTAFALGTAATLALKVDPSASQPGADLVLAVRYRNAS